MTPRIRALIAPGGAVVLVALIGALSACGDLTRPKAQQSNFTDTVAINALNFAPRNAPVALALFSGLAVRADASFSFDLAFDIDANGKALLLPVRTVAGGLAPSHTVGLQRSDSTFEALAKAPDNKAYKYDSVFVASVGDVFVIESSDPSACGISYYSTVFYAKLQVLSIDPALHTIRTRFTVDPNCGFFSLIPTGTPRD
jgi:hypothetical protein